MEINAAFCLANRTWIAPSERGGGANSNVQGRFGHAAVIANEGGAAQIYVYGGFNTPLSGYTYAITDDLLVYNVEADAWRAEANGGAPRFRHSAVLIDNWMLV